MMKPSHALVLLLTGLWPAQAAAQGVDSHALEQALQRGVDRIPILSEPGGLVAAPGGDFLYVAGEDEVGLGIFERDPANGRLGYLTNHPLTVDFGDGNRRVHVDALTLSPDGQNLYASGFLAAGPSDFRTPLVSLRRDPQTGGLETLQVLGPGVIGERGLQFVSALAVSPDGRQLYAAAAGALLVFDRDPASGLLSVSEALEEGLQDRNLSTVAVSPDGRHVYASETRPDSPAGETLVFERDGATGRLAPPQRLPVSLENLALTADGRTLLGITPPPFPTLLEFARDAQTGLLEPLDEIDLSEGFPSSRENGLAITPDGAWAAHAGRVGGLSRLTILRRRGERLRIQQVSDPIRDDFRLGGLGRALWLAGGDHLYLLTNDGLLFFGPADDDGDGLRNLDEDADGDGDPSNDDRDGDGAADFRESDIADSDGDGIVVVLDTDDDGDGVPTREEDPDGDGDPTDDDTDEDVTPDYLDPDDDGDRVPTASEDPNSNGDPRDDDTDGDGVPNYRDSDDDGDSLHSLADEDIDRNSDPRDDDTDADGTPDYLDPDDDGDGILTLFEISLGDSDVDGIPDYLDADDDGDGIPTRLEDSDGDGNPANDDRDGDGDPDYLEHDLEDADGDGLFDVEDPEFDAGLVLPVVVHGPVSARLEYLSHLRLLNPSGQRLEVELAAFFNDGRPAPLFPPRDPGDDRALKRFELEPLEGDTVQTRGEGFDPRTLGWVLVRGEGLAALEAAAEVILHRTRTSVPAAAPTGFFNPFPGTQRIVSSLQVEAAQPVRNFVAAVDSMTGGQRAAAFAVVNPSPTRTARIRVTSPFGETVLELPPLSRRALLQEDLEATSSVEPQVTPPIPSIFAFRFQSDTPVAVTSLIVFLRDGRLIGGLGGPLAGAQPVP